MKLERSSPSLLTGVCCLSVVVAVGASNRMRTMVIPHGLDAYFESKKLAKSAKGISRGLTEVQMLCKLTIHIFSGMRDEEAISLPYFCIEAVRKIRMTPGSSFAARQKIRTASIACHAYVARTAPGDIAG